MIPVKINEKRLWAISQQVPHILQLSVSFPVPHPHISADLLPVVMIATSLVLTVCQAVFCRLFYLMTALVPLPLPSTLQPNLPFLKMESDHAT